MRRECILYKKIMARSFAIYWLAREAFVFVISQTETSNSCKYACAGAALATPCIHPKMFCGWKLNLNISSLESYINWTPLLPSTALKGAAEKEEEWVHDFLHSQQTQTLYVCTMSYLIKYFFAIEMAVSRPRAKTIQIKTECLFGVFN